MTVVRILGTDMPITISATLLEDEALGTYSPVRAEIEIYRDVTPQNAGEILVHEILEAISYKLELKLKHQQISAVASALHQAMRDNPHLFGRIAGGLHPVEDACE